MPKCRVNNVVLDNERKDNTYQSVIIDLALAGAIDQGKAEALLGYSISEKLRTPYWYKAKAASTTQSLADSSE